MDEEKGVNATCGECGKSAAEGWALYCVSCYEESMVKAAVAAEREACALIVENCCSYCAERIRERDGKPRKPMQHAVSVNDITKAALKIFKAELTKQEPMRHPGYIIGDHWLQAAYTRVCTGEDIRAVMEDYGYYP